MYKEQKSEDRGNVIKNNFERGRETLKKLMSVMKQDLLSVNA